MKKPLTDRQKRARKNQNCSLGKIHRDCGLAVVRTIGGMVLGKHETIRICDRHWKLLMDIKADADAKAGKKPRKALKEAA